MIKGWIRCKLIETNEMFAFGKWIDGVFFSDFKWFLRIYKFVFRTRRIFQNSKVLFQLSVSFMSFRPLSKFSNSFSIFGQFYDPRLDQLQDSKTISWPLTKSIIVGQFYEFSTSTYGQFTLFDQFQDFRSVSWFMIFCQSKTIN